MCGTKPGGHCYCGAVRLNLKYLGVRLDRPLSLRVLPSAEWLGDDQL